MNAKKAPTRYKRIETQKIIVDHFFARPQLAASCASVGHAEDEVARAIALSPRHPPAHAKSSALFSESHINCGNAPRRDTRVEPNPIATIRAGSAQHTRVLAERKSVKVDKTLFVILNTLNI
jgi:hypothetical protein